MSRRTSTPGMTLLEILLVLAIVGILVGVGITMLSRLGRNQAYQGYVSGFEQAVSGATSRANETNTVYALVFDGAGYRWGPVAGALTACDSASAAPALASVAARRSAPSGVGVGSSGWLCFSAPGLVYRLSSLGKCAYKSYSFPCLTFSGPGNEERVFISVGGQVVVQ